MPIANAVKQLLDQRDIAFSLVDCSSTEQQKQAIQELGIKPDHWLTTSFLHDPHGPLMVIHSRHRRPNLSQINRVLKRQLSWMNATNQVPLFQCAPGCTVPIPELVGLPCIVDQGALSGESIVCSSGCQDSYIQLNSADYRQLLNTATIAPITGSSLAVGETWQQLVNRWQHLDLQHHPLLTNPPQAQTQDGLLLIDQVEKLDSLMPCSTQAIEDLSQWQSDPWADANRLQELMRQHPALSSTVLAFLNSIIPGRQRVMGIEQAIHFEYGMEVVAAAATGIAIREPLQVPRKGPMGRLSLWRHACHSACLAYRLAYHNPHLPLRPAHALLCGLSQNIGISLLGHLYPFEFQRLNTWLETRADDSTDVAFSHCQPALDGNHGWLGAWLLDHWQLPEYVVINTREQSRAPSYHARCWPLVHLTHYTNRLLSDEHDTLSDKAKLTLTSKTVPLALNTLKQRLNDIERMAQEWAA